MIELSNDFLAVQFRHCVVVCYIVQGQIKLRQTCTNMSEAEKWVKKYGR